MSSSDATPVSRRRVLAAGVLGAAAIGAMSWATRLVWRSKPTAKELIRERLSYLTFGDDVVDAFLRDHKAAHYEQTDVFNAIHLLFLLSTDFFQNGANESRPLTYVSYFNGYERFCGHPFAREATP